MVKRARDHQLSAKNLGFNPGSEYGAEHVLAYKYIIKKYPDMPREEATAKAMQFDDHSAQIFGYFFRKKMDLSIDQALLFNEYHKMAFIYAHRNNIELSLRELFQITNVDQVALLKKLINQGVDNKKDLCAIMEIAVDKVPSAEEVVTVVEEVPVSIVEEEPVIVIEEVPVSIVEEEPVTVVEEVPVSIVEEVSVEVVEVSIVGDAPALESEL